MAIATEVRDRQYAAEHIRSAVEEVRYLAKLSAPARLRTMSEFAEQEVVIPDGEYAGWRYSLNTQPAARLWFDEIDSGRWCRFAGTGPQQSGKSLSFYIIPAMYHLFEMQETVICGLPTMDLARDKWNIDLKPAIAASRYADLLPSKGPGSRGGATPELITFKNGARLKFMSGGGGDEKRSAFTSRVLVVTEADKLDESGGNSRESDKLQQMEGRTRSYDKRRRVYLECTVSTEEGRIWQEIKRGTDSRIVIPCVGCESWVTPEREHLVNWDHAEDEWSAEDAQFSCPACGQLWSEDDRHQSNSRSRLLHRGQSIDDSGNISGDTPRTHTLGFRYSAVNNAFVSAGTIGIEEWRAKRSVDQDAHDRSLCQWVWVVPPKPLSDSLVHLDIESIIARQHSAGRGEVPGAADVLTGGIDIGKRRIHWTVTAWGNSARGYVVDYGDVSVPIERFGVEKGIQYALSEIRDRFDEGFHCGGGYLSPVRTLVDCRYLPDVIYQWCRNGRNSGSVRDVFLPAMGHGRGQDFGSGHYRPPKKPGGHVIAIEPHYYVQTDAKAKLAIVHVDANYWKTYVHNRLADPDTAESVLTLFESDPEDHREYAQHLTAERQVESHGEKGTELVWERVRKANHWLDTTALAVAAGHVAGVRSQRPAAKPSNRRKRKASRSKRNPWVDRMR